MERPDNVTDEHIEFLNDLRERAIINMFGAAPFLADHFGIDKKEAREILSYWMKSF